MTWDFAEVNPFSDSSGGYGWATQSGSLRSLDWLPATATRHGCDRRTPRRPRALGVISTDPPYYDNIGYSDLSDFFYVWLRRSLRDDLSRPVSARCSCRRLRNWSRIRTDTTGKSGAQRVLRGRLPQGLRSRRGSPRQADYPITVYYAFKQSEADEAGEASTGWETLLEGMIRSGWEITSTWPIRTEVRWSDDGQRHECARILDRAVAAASAGRRADDRPSRLHRGAGSRTSRRACGSCSKGRSRRSTFRRRRSVQAWRSSVATARSWSRTARR